MTDPGSVSNLVLPAGNIGNPVLRNITATKYIDEANPAKTISVNLTAEAGTKTITRALEKISDNNGTMEYKLAGSPYTAAIVGAIGNATNPVITYSGNWSVKDDGHAAYPIIMPTDRDPGDPTQGNLKYFGFPHSPSTITFALNDKDGPVDVTAMDQDILKLEVNTGANTYILQTKIVEINANTPDYTASYNEANQTVTVNLKRVVLQP